MQRLFFAASLLLVYSAFAQQNNTVYENQYASAIRKIREKNYTASSIELTQLIDAGYAESEAYTKRGISYYYLGEYKKALDDFNEAELLGSQSAELNQFKGITCYELDQFDDAVTNLEKALLSGARNFEVYYNLANAKFALKKYYFAQNYSFSLT